MLARALSTLRGGQGRLAPLASAWRGLAGEPSAAAASGSNAAAATEQASTSDAPATASEAALASQQQPVEHIISVDRSALYNPQLHSHDPVLLAAAAQVEKEEETELARHFKAVIQASVVW